MISSSVLHTAIKRCIGARQAWLAIVVLLVASGCSNTQTYVVSKLTPKPEGLHLVRVIPNEANATVSQFSVNGVWFVVRMSNGVHIDKPHDSDGLRTSAMTVAMWRTSDDGEISKFSGKVVFGDGRELLPNQVDEISSLCVTDAKPLIIKKAVDGGAVKIVRRSADGAEREVASAETCVRMVYPEIVDPRKAFSLELGTLVRNAEQLPIRLDFEPAIYKSISH